jgi:hypothetical protein
MIVMANRWSGMKAFGIMMILATGVLSSPATAQSAAEKPVDSAATLLGGVKTVQSVSGAVEKIDTAQQAEAKAALQAAEKAKAAKKRRLARAREKQKKMGRRKRNKGSERQQANNAAGGKKNSTNNGSDATNINGEIDGIDADTALGIAETGLSAIQTGQAAAEALELQAKADKEAAAFKENLEEGNLNAATGSSKRELESRTKQKQKENEALGHLSSTGGAALGALGDSKVGGAEAGNVGSAIGIAAEGAKTVGSAIQANEAANRAQRFNTKADELEANGNTKVAEQFRRMAREEDEKMRVAAEQGAGSGIKTGIAVACAFAVTPQAKAACAVGNTAYGVTRTVIDNTDGGKQLEEHKADWIAGLDPEVQAAEAAARKQEEALLANLQGRKKDADSEASVSGSSSTDAPSEWSPEMVGIDEQISVARAEAGEPSRERSTEPGSLDDWEAENPPEPEDPNASVGASAVEGGSTNLLPEPNRVEDPPPGIASLDDWETSNPSTDPESNDTNALREAETETDSAARNGGTPGNQSPTMSSGGLFPGQEFINTNVAAIEPSSGWSDGPAGGARVMNERARAAEFDHAQQAAEIDGQGRELGQAIDSSRTQHEAGMRETAARRAQRAEFGNAIGGAIAAGAAQGAAQFGGAVGRAAGQQAVGYDPHSEGCSGCGDSGGDGHADGSSGTNTGATTTGTAPVPAGSNTPECQRLQALQQDLIANIPAAKSGDEAAMARHAQYGQQQVGLLNACMASLPPDARAVVEQSAGGSIPQAAPVNNGGSTNVASSGANCSALASTLSGAQAHLARMMRNGSPNDIATKKPGVEREISDAKAAMSRAGC